MLSYEITAIFVACFYFYAESVHIGVMRTVLDCLKTQVVKCNNAYVELLKLWILLSPQVKSVVRW